MRAIVNKKIFNKIIIIILLLIFFQLVSCIPVYAVDADVLVEPITALFANLGDGIMEIMQKTFLDVETSGAWLESESGFWEKFLLIAAAVIIAVVAVVAIVYSGGTALTIVPALFGALVKITAVGTIAYFAMEVLHIGEERNLFTRLLSNT